MTKLPCVSAAEPFFLESGTGQRFCLYYPPANEKDIQRSLIYVHPFAEELNRSRSVAAHQARAFASAGIGVLQIDLLGCGDSSGDFGEASWSCWKDDLAAAYDWLTQHSSASIGLWGLRLGALLALDFTFDKTRQIEQIILWKPVLNGKIYFSQFLRVHLASQMLMDTNYKQVSIADLRSTLQLGETIEVAGYEVGSELAASIESLLLKELKVADVNIHWFDTIPNSEQGSSPTIIEIVRNWRAEKINVALHSILNADFWAVEDANDNSALLSATTSVYLTVKQ